MKLGIALIQIGGVTQAKATPEWYESFFGDDYYEIYADVISTETTLAQGDGIISLLEIEPGARILDLAHG